MKKNLYYFGPFQILKPSIHMIDNPKKIYADAYIHKDLAQQPRPKGKSQNHKKLRLNMNYYMRDPNL